MNIEIFKKQIEEAKPVTQEQADNGDKYESGRLKQVGDIVLYGLLLTDCKNKEIGVTLISFHIDEIDKFELSENFQNKTTSLPVINRKYF